jgi:RNA polymerase sigma factor (sigma-70 family)
MLKLIEQHYLDNRQRLVKKLTFRAGTPEAGEDIVQTAYERAIRYRRSCDPERFNQWFAMLLNNALRDYKNEERGYTPLEDGEEEPDDTGCPHYPEHILREILELIDTKSEVQIEVLTLFFKQGYSAIDISRLTDHSYAKSHQIIQRFRNELKDLYRE